MPWANEEPGLEAIKANFKEAIDKIRTESDEKTYQEKAWETYFDKHKEAVADNVNHPAHYITEGSIECIEAIEAQLTLEGYRGYLRGNCAKYLWRCDNKGHTKQDLEKCEWYLKRLLLTFDV